MPVEWAAATAARPVASWSGWPSERHGIRQRSSGPRRSARKSATCPCSPPHIHRPRATVHPGGATTQPIEGTAGLSGPDQRKVMTRGPRPGCEASPSVTATTTVSTRAPAMDCSRPPAPSTSSSGCGATTIRRRGCVVLEVGVPRDEVRRAKCAHRYPDVSSSTTSSTANPHRPGDQGRLHPAGRDTAPDRP